MLLGFIKPIEYILELLDLQDEVIKPNKDFINFYTC